MIPRQFSLNYFSRQNVGKQLRTLYLFTIAIPILLIGGIIYFFSFRQITGNYEHLSELKARQVRSIMTTTTLSLQDIYSTLMSDAVLQDILEEDFVDQETAMDILGSYRGFEDILKNSAILTDIRLYVNEDYMKSNAPCGYFYPITNDLKKTDWFQQAASTRGTFWKSELRIGQFDIHYWELNYYCRIPIPQKSSYAVLVMTVSDNHLRSLIADNEYDIYISVNSDPVFYCSNRDYVGKPFPVDPASATTQQTSGKMEILDTPTIATLTAMTPYATSDRICILAASQDAIPYLHRMELIFALTIFFALLISGVLIFLYTQYFSNRIQTLRLAMHKVSHNDYAIVNSIRGDDELSATFSDLKTMINKLKETEAKIYQAQLNEQRLYNQQQQMELKLLTSQINPHFLFNTLETIRMKAFSEGNREVATAIKLLGKSMRYVLNNTKDTAATLDKEIDYIRTYLAIQKMRFGDRLNYTIRIDETLNLSQYRILPLLIQPIVENAISHGLKDSEECGHVILKLYRSTDDLLIADIFDNGRGMAAEELESVIRHMDIPQPESDHGVGLYNINNRVHLFYGSQYGLSIKSKCSVGTLVTLTIPLVNLTEEEV